MTGRVHDSRRLGKAHLLLGVTGAHHGAVARAPRPAPVDRAGLRRAAAEAVRAA